MRKTVHVHVHNHATRDGWEEGKHPRADDGKFGSGGGSGSDKGEGSGSDKKGPAKAKKGEVHFKEAKDGQGRTVFKLYDKKGEHVGTVASEKAANTWWADHGGKKAAEAHDRGESGKRS